MLRWNQRSLRRWQECAAGWWRWAPLPLAAAYLAILLAKFTQIIANVFLNADFASGPVIGELFSQRGPHTTVVLGYVPWYATLFSNSRLNGFRRTERFGRAQAI